MGPWENVEKYGSDSSSVIITLSNAAPPMKPPKDIAELGAIILERIGAENMACYLFSSLQSARECVEYSTSERRDSSSGKKSIPQDQITIRAFTAVDRFFAVIFPHDSIASVAGFWNVSGAGISSRFAETALKHINRLSEVPILGNDAVRPGFESIAHRTIRERIAQHVRRAPLVIDLPRPYADDVYLFQTGMAAIYKPHTYMLRRSKGTVVLFGMALMDTLALFEEFGTGFKFFGNGNDKDLDALEEFLEQEYQRENIVKAIWAEFPANPLLATPDLTRLRALADKYEVVLAIDDTVGSWANVDIIHLADMLVTSLTKSFNGYADAMAGSVVINPESRVYHYLKSLFDHYHVPELYVDDAEVVEKNSRNYLSRTAQLNHNASSLVQYLLSCAEDPDSAVKAVYYPSVNRSVASYRKFMRPAAPDFSPGYGCLLCVELEDLPTTAAFYDNLNVHKGPHLGASVTLAFAFTMCAYKDRLEWAEQYGLKPTQIRISAGLEDTEMLVQDFRVAVEAANKIKHHNPSVT